MRARCCRALWYPVAPFTGSVDWNSAAVWLVAAKIGRSLHRERGLKSPAARIYTGHSQSLPSQGAWIEIPAVHGMSSSSALSLPSQGAWIEILSMSCAGWATRSLPSQGAWIEITYPERAVYYYQCRSLHRERGLKLFWDCYSPVTAGSLPSQGAWIEMRFIRIPFADDEVAPFTGSVDWNSDVWRTIYANWCRSLHRERGLKSPWNLRNYMVHCRSLHRERGLKFFFFAQFVFLFQSLPSQGAWIEIHLLKTFCTTLLSLPSQGAWIEIVIPFSLYCCVCVAPFTGSVDWNERNYT